MKIVCVGWRLSREEDSVLESIVKFLEKKIPNAEITKVDGFRHTITDGDEYITFGKTAYQSIDEDKNEPWPMLSVKDLKKNRKKSLEDLDAIIESIKMRMFEKPIKKEIYVETKDGISIGKEACNINITEQEAEYLKSLRDMLGGSKMVISKGDIRIEVE